MCPAGRPQSRNFTGIEKRVGRVFCDTVLTDLSAAFDKVSPVSFRIDYLETNPRGLLIARPPPCRIKICKIATVSPQWSLTRICAGRRDARGRRIAARPERLGDRVRSLRHCHFHANN